MTTQTRLSLGSCLSDSAIHSSVSRALVPSGSFGNTVSAFGTKSITGSPPRLPVHSSEIFSADEILAGVISSNLAEMVSATFFARCFFPLPRPPYNRSPGGVAASRMLNMSMLRNRNSNTCVADRRIAPDPLDAVDVLDQPLELRKLKRNPLLAPHDLAVLGERWQRGDGESALLVHGFGQERSVVFHQRVVRVRRDHRDGAPGVHPEDRGVPDLEEERAGPERLRAELVVRGRRAVGCPDADAAVDRHPFVDVRTLVRIDVRELQRLQVRTLVLEGRQRDLEHEMPFDEEGDRNGSEVESSRHPRKAGNDGLPDVADKPPHGEPDANLQQQAAPPEETPHRHEDGGIEEQLRQAPASCHDQRMETVLQRFRP